MTTQACRQPFLVLRLLLASATLLWTTPVHGWILPAPIIHTACGFAAGSAGAIAAYPIDFVKSQPQTDQGRARYKGGMDAAMEIVREGGPLALYRGAFVNIIGIAPEKTIKLSVNDAARMAIQGHYGYLPILGEVLAGSLAGMTQVTVTNPLEVVKIRMQTSTMSIHEVLSQCKSVGDYYQGAAACVVRDSMFSAVLFPLYAHAKVWLAASFVAMMTGGGGDHAGSTTTTMAMMMTSMADQHHDVSSGVINFWANMMAGSLAAAPAAAISTPADVIKTRMQQSREAAASESDHVDGSSKTAQLTPPPSVIDVARTIIQTEGPEVLMSGWFERVVRSVPQFGVTLAVFDVLSNMAIHHGLMVAAASS